MTVEELVCELRRFPDYAEVRIAEHDNTYHPTCAIKAVVEDNVTEQDERQREHKKLIVYIAEGRQLGYLPGKAMHDLDW